MLRLSEFPRAFGKLRVNGLPRPGHKALRGLLVKQGVQASQVARQVAPEFGSGEEGSQQASVSQFF